MIRTVLLVLAILCVAAIAWSLIPPPCERAQHRQQSAELALAELRVQLRTAALDAGWDGADERGMRAALRRCDLGPHEELDRVARRLCNDPVVRRLFERWERDRRVAVEQLLGTGQVCTP